MPERSWLAIVAALFALGALGAGLARFVYGNPLKWAMVLIIAGGLLSLVGIKLRIV